MIGIVICRVCSDDGGKFVMCSGDSESLCSCGMVTVGECVCSADST